VALADLFQDQLDKARETFNKMQQAKGYAALDGAQLFVGPDAFHQIAASKELDAIVIATPPYYHPGIWRRRSPRASTFISKSGGCGCARGFEGDRNRQARPRKLSLMSVSKSAIARLFWRW